jgi:ABC transporter/Haemolysin-type calcium binding protein related domain
MAIEPQMQRRWEEQLAGYVGSRFRRAFAGQLDQPGGVVHQQDRHRADAVFRRASGDRRAVTVGELIAFNMFRPGRAQPVLRLAQLWRDFHQARVSIARLGDILNTTPEPAFSAAPPPIPGDISFDHVSFRYRIDGPTALNDISLKISAGQVIDIVGPSGSGKSTSQNWCSGFMSAAVGGSVYGYWGNDMINAGLGDKYLNGSGGSDTSAGGNDIIADPSNFLSTLQFADIASKDLTFSRANGGADLVIADTVTGKTVTVQREFANGGPLLAITFADGTSWNNAAIHGAVTTLPGLVPPPKRR